MSTLRNAPTFSQSAAPNVSPDPAATRMRWRQYQREAFWKAIPAWQQVDAATFCDHRWQERNAVTRLDQLAQTLGTRINPAFVADVAAGMRASFMTVRIPPYLLALMDWNEPYTDPLRRQFLPLGSEREEDHTLARLDSLGEQDDAPVPGLVHRYPDRVLLLTTDFCPAYCRFCTRSYAVGGDTQAVSKIKHGQERARWERALDYIAAHEQIEDVVLSGGDAFRLTPESLRFLGQRLLAIPHVRRVRVATKGLAVLPMKILTDTDWFDALVAMTQNGRQSYKEVAIHTHFNHPNEFTGITEDALHRLTDAGIVVRNQSVLLRGVNDDAPTQILLNRCLRWLNVRPYYTYLGDMVQGSEDLRSSLADAIRLEKAVRGSLSGPDMPAYILDAPGGGGKRDIHSYEHYDRESGLSVFTAAAVKPGRYFLYADPLRDLCPAMQRRWHIPAERQEMIRHALAAVS